MPVGQDHVRLISLLGISTEKEPAAKKLSFQVSFTGLLFGCDSLSFALWATESPRGEVTS